MYSNLDNKWKEEILSGTHTGDKVRIMQKKKCVTTCAIVFLALSTSLGVFASGSELKSKGIIWDGFDADICIFDADKIKDKASFTDCKARAEGLNYVLVGGEVVAENAVFNGKCCGKVLLRED